MSETLPTPTNARSEIDKLNDMFDTPAYEPGESTGDSFVESTNDKRELSTTGSFLTRAAERISTLGNTLEQRALDRAHSEALKEYKDRDYNGYVDHLSVLQDSEENSPEANQFAAYELGKEERRADREAKREAAKEKVCGIGRSAINKLKAGGEITLGLTLIGVEKAKSATLSAKDSAVEKTMVGAQAVKDKTESLATATKASAQRTLESAGKKVTDTVSAAEVLAGKVGAKAEASINNGIDSINYTLDAANQAVEYRRQAAAKKKEVALSHKYARHARWFNVKRSAKTRGQEAIDSARDTAEQTRKAARIRTSAGRRALLAYRDAIDAHR